MDFTNESKNEVCGADLIFAGSATRRVKVLGLHARGAYLDRATLPSSIRDGVEVKIGLRIPPNSLDGYMRVKGTIALYTKYTNHTQQAEVRFLDPPSQFLIALNEYLETQNIKRKSIIDTQQQYLDKQQYLNALSLKAVGMDAVNLLTKMLNAFATGLEKRGERAHSDFERRIAIDDATFMRRACSQDSWLLNLAGTLLKIETIDKSDYVQEFDVVLNEHTDLVLTMQSIIDQLMQQLSVPLQQLSYRLEELQAGINVSPPFSPKILVKLLEKTLSALELSMEGKIYSLRCINDFIPELMQLYQKLLAAWDTH